MKTKFSKVIYHASNPHWGITHFSVGVNLKTLILVGIIPGMLDYTRQTNMYHAHVFISVFTLEITAIF